MTTVMVHGDATKIYIFLDNTPNDLLIFYVPKCLKIICKDHTIRNSNKKKTKIKTTENSLSFLWIILNLPTDDHINLTRNIMCIFIANFLLNE